MRVLYVVGTNLSRNTSANISHNAYVQGLLENGCKVDILMSSASWGEKDDALPTWKEAQYFTYNSVSNADRLKKYFKAIFDKQSPTHRTSVESKLQPKEKISQKKSIKKIIRTLLKWIYDFIFNTSQLYNLERTWLQNAKHFKESAPYDLIVSNSSPAASHKLVSDLISKKRISKTRWIQIWEDPWFFDLYGGHTEEVKKEEHRLLQAAQEVYYVSTLTLHYQKKHFPDCADKMKHVPLPYLKLEENHKKVNKESIQFGYFGDYYAHTRNLQPFYNAVVTSDAKALIIGDSDLNLKPTNSVSIKGRITLDKLNVLQNQTDVLVHLCNIRGGQIPGKIYHYSATTKPILFILDGTPEEIILIKDYFSQFNRYIFCENRKDDILQKIDDIKKGVIQSEEKPVLAFSPKQVVKELIKI